MAKITKAAIADIKAAKAKTTTEDRKHFIILGYRMRGDKMHLRVIEDFRSDNTITDKAIALSMAREVLSKPRFSNDMLDGVVVFESIGLVRPKKIDVEVEEVPLT